MFRTTRFQLNFLILIEFPNILHWKAAKKINLGVVLGQNLGKNYVQCCEKSKETGNTIRFFSYFTWDYFSKQKAVVVKPREWKFIAIIARNTKF